MVTDQSKPFWSEVGKIDEFSYYKCVKYVFKKLKVAAGWLLKYRLFVASSIPVKNITSLISNDSTT